MQTEGKWGHIGRANTKKNLENLLSQEKRLKLNFQKNSLFKSWPFF